MADRIAGNRKSLVADRQVADLSARFFQVVILAHRACRKLARQNPGHCVFVVVGENVAYFFPAHGTQFFFRD
jgi:predicted alpha/beta-fold hydrolase